jgi:hypothetical protein
LSGLYWIENVSGLPSGSEAVQPRVTGPLAGRAGPPLRVVMVMTGGLALTARVAISRPAVSECSAIRRVPGIQSTTRKNAPASGASETTSGVKA